MVRLQCSILHFFKWGVRPASFRGRYPILLAPLPSNVLLGILITTEWFEGRCTRLHLWVSPHNVESHRMITPHTMQEDSEMWLYIPTHHWNGCGWPKYHIEGGSEAFVDVGQWKSGHAWGGPGQDVMEWSDSSTLFDLESPMCQETGVNLYGLGFRAINRPNKNENAV